jgi:hypothetical protein
MDLEWANRTDAGTTKWADSNIHLPICQTAHCRTAGRWQERNGFVASSQARALSDEHDSASYPVITKRTIIFRHTADMFSTVLRSKTALALSVVVMRYKSAT